MLLVMAGLSNSKAGPHSAELDDAQKCAVRGMDNILARSLPQMRREN